ncbi:hypothetical protein HB981_01255 [Listeria seeligeri]|uniref:AbiH family protein n=1 Tax=Listeria seeligeri TaxID=1640 RepID=UPI00162A229F|nr:AbiH family protein [Listeria seeligeri]MBC1526929.1 hypothetical protein [Listeria seeligeri]MBC1725136.1 hypothetical protein [Listeria seeligeri]MBC1728930.1 hypothetical protein [Listeria seeligeri]MBC1734795.1 hypothetical protein [Listeria seeligeri]MBC1738622.1 hypothetical protein [Listeria seeligeri]
MRSINKLFIIGNGFDLVHGIPSTFNHFKEYFRYTCLYKHDVYSNPWLTSLNNYNGNLKSGAAFITENLYGSLGRWEENK